MIKFFIISAQHTGTWAVIDNFERRGKPVGLWSDLGHSKPGVHAHLSAGSINNIHELDKKHHIDKSMFNLLTHSSTPIYCPIRDPLAAIITRENRVPNLEHWFILEGLATILDSWKRVELIPVYKGATFRGKKLLIKNSWQDNTGLKAAYNKKDWQTIKDYLAPYWERLHSPEWITRLQLMQSYGINLEWYNK